MSTIVAIARVARMQLAIAVRSPIAWLTVAGFLVLQGVSFATLVAVLSDPSRPAPVGAALEGHFAGTLLGWAIQLTAIAAIAARAAEDRRTGAWEALVSAPIGEGAALVGVWLGGVALYAIAWLPTVFYAVALSAWAPGSGALDPGPVVAGYLGGLVLGATALAIAVAAGAAVRHGLAATMAGFAVLMLWLIVGELGALWPTLPRDHPSLAHAVERYGPRAIAMALARGAIAPAHLVWLGGLTVGALAIAAAAVGRGRRRAGRTALGLWRGALLVIAAALAAVLAERAHEPWDVSRAGRNHLDRDTARALDRLTAPVAVTIVPPAIDRLAPLYAEVERVLTMMARRQPGLSVRRWAPRDAATLTDAAAAAVLEERELARGGAVIVTRGARRRVVGLLDLAEVGRDAIAAPAFTRIAIEQALARALIELGDDAPRVVCTATGAGERPAAWAGVWARLAEDGVAIEPLVDPAAIPARCSAVAVIAARTAWPAPAQAGLDAYLGAGGALVVAVGDDGPSTTGVDAMLAGWGLGLAPGWVIDPSGAIDGFDGFRVTDGYQEHPITDGFRVRRVTVWRGARPLRVASPAQALVLASPQARVDDGPALAAPLAVAAVAARGAGRVAVVTGALAGDPGTELLAARAVAWLIGRQPEVAVPAKGGDQLRLALTASERRAIAGLAVVGLPLALVALLAALARRPRP
ncbi:MAG: Gldg family protein [Kofleriaceae bacterium]|nr:Gldg family protein [Kofleriaceae bacterium]MBP9170999.1 Gldg family protein [Kofleriaceae bacterium]MBP9860640.1 Gldg family protein [Kofleriaceae bacterium]